VIHGRRIHAAQRLALPGVPSGFVASGTLLSEAASTSMLAGPLALSAGVTLAMRLPLTLARSLAVLLACAVCSRSAATAPPSTSLPSGAAGRRIRSLIHVALFCYVR